MKRLTAILAGTALLTLTACAGPGYPIGDNTYPDYSYGGRTDYPEYGSADYPDYDRTGYGGVGYSRSDYGMIESITVEEPKSGIGVGAVAGGVVGGLLGNQVGKGKGKTAATIAGAAGGAYAGHQIQKHTQRNNLVYRMTVRMQDGSYQTVTQDVNTPLRVGDRVRIVDGKAYPL